MKKTLMYVLFLLVLLPFVFSEIGSFFGPQSPPGQAPGHVCTPAGCVVDGDINFQNFSMINAFIYNTTLQNVTLINVTLYNVFIINSSGDILMNNNDILDIDYITANNWSNISINSSQLLNPTWVERAGDTMTGNLTIDVAMGDVELRLESSINKHAYLYLMENSVFGFRLWYDGSGINIFKFDAIDNGVIKPQIWFNRDTGNIEFFTSLDLSGYNMTADYFYGSGAFLINLNVTGNVSLNDDIDISGHTLTSSFLAGPVGGIDMRGSPWYFSGSDWEFASNVDINYNLNVDGNVSIGGDLNMSNNSITDVDTLFVHNITGRSSIFVGSEMRLADGIFGDGSKLYGLNLSSINGTSVFNDNVIINGNLTVDGEINGGYIDKYTDGNFKGSLYTQKTDSSLSDSNSIFQVVSDTRGTPQFMVQDGGANQASLLVRSWIVVNQNNTLLNSSQNNICSAWGFKNLDCNTSTTGADFGVTDDLEVRNIIWAGKGLKTEPQQFGVHLELGMGSNFPGGNNGVYDTINNYFCDDTTTLFNSSTEGWIELVAEGTKYEGGMAHIHVVVNSSCVEVGHNPGWTEDITTPIQWVIQTPPELIANGNGAFVYNVGDQLESIFEISIENGTGFSGVFFDDTAGTDQHQAFTLNQNINNYDGIVGLDMFSYSDVPVTENDYHSMLLEIDTTNINDSGLTYIGAVHFGENINNEIDFLHLIGDFDNIIKSGTGDILERAYYDDVTTTTDVTTEFNTVGSDVTIFDVDSSIIYLGSIVNFTTIGISLDTQSSSNINAIYYYCNNAGNWVVLPGVTDTTNGMKTSGTLHFINPIDRGICNFEIDSTPFADITNYHYIAVQRTRNNVVIPPIESLISISGGGNLMFLRDDYMKLNPVDTAPESCSAISLGGIYYDISEDNMCVCKSTGWKVMEDGTDCT